MNFKIVRWKKEARSLLWPWLAVVATGLSPLIVRHGVTEALVGLNVIFLLPLLATLVIANEFDLRTTALWLTQPFSRMQLWTEKTIVLFAAVASAAVASSLGMLSSVPAEAAPLYRLMMFLYVVAIITSAVFWTLSARSVLGGVVLNLCAIGAIFWIPVAAVSGAIDFDDAVVQSLAKTLTPLFLIYSAGMLWLGARKLARFELTGAISSDDLITSGPSLMPESMAAWFRCRPTGAVSNLVRKELRILRPLWLVTLADVTLLFLLGALHLLPDPKIEIPRVLTLPYYAAIIMFLGFFLHAILPGALSMGEERTLGTHAWHLTLPISISRQWLVKLLVAMAASQLCAVALPLAALVAAGSIHGTPWFYVGVPSISAWVLMVALITLAAFWSACVANGTTRAVTMLFPIMLAISVAMTSGMTLGLKTTAEFGSIMDLFISLFHLNPETLRIWWPSPNIALVPLVLFAVVQTYGLFRTQAQESLSWLLRCAAPGLSIAFLTPLLLLVTFYSNWSPFWETQRAVDKLVTGTAFQMSGDDLARTARLSPPTRRWLAGSKISALPDPHLGSTNDPRSFLMSIQLSGGVNCQTSVIHVGPHPVSLHHSCVDKPR